MLRTLAIVIPAYNEAGSIAQVLLGIPNKINGIDKIATIVVDDGSKDATYQEAKKIADHVVRHVVNLGVGAATISGYEAAKRLGADIAVTIDGDGQHSPGDIAKVIEPILKDQADVVLGTRMKNNKTMPKIKIVGNWIMNFVTFLVFGRWTTDSQSGMRAVSKKALSKMTLNSTGYEICSEIIGEVQRTKLKMVEVPIATIYTDYATLKGQHVLNAINILTRIIFIRLGSLK